MCMSNNALRLSSVRKSSHVMVLSDLTFSLAGDGRVADPAFPDSAGNLVGSMQTLRELELSMGCNCVGDVLPILCIATGGLELDWRRWWGCGRGSGCECK